MKKLVILSALFVFAAASNLQADGVQTITEGNCTYTVDAFVENGNIYEIIIEAVSNSSSVSTQDACYARPVGKITFKAKEGALN